MTVESDPDEDVEVGVPGSDSSSELVLLVEGGVTKVCDGLEDAKSVLIVPEEDVDVEGVSIPSEELEGGVSTPVASSPAFKSVAGVYSIDSFPDLYASKCDES